MSSSDTTPGQAVAGHGLGRWVGRHRFLAYVVIAYAFSWSLWLVSSLGGGQIPFLLGVLGPMVAAAIVTVVSGGSLMQWLRILGSPVDWSLAADRLPAYLSTFVFVLFLGDGLEEPGWRGFGLPVLQEKYPPLLATVILGLVWGIWHVPLYGIAGFVVPLVLAFFYTLLWNATHSVGLCILLHASFTPAQDHLLLTPPEATEHGLLAASDLVILGTYIAGALLVIVLTRGRLGAPPSRQAS